MKTCKVVWVLVEDEEVGIKKVAMYGLGNVGIVHDIEELADILVDFSNIEIAKVHNDINGIHVDPSTLVPPLA